MSEHGMKPTAIADIALPFEVVELKHWKTKDGGPVFVQCDRLDRLKIAQITNRLPGLFETLGQPTSDTSEKLEQFRPLGAALIEAGAFFVDAFGRPQRPSFWNTTPVDGAVPISLLDTEDFVMLANTLLKLRGYVGGAAEDGGFPAGQPRGEGRGARTVDGREGDGSDAAGSTGAPGPSVHGDDAASAPGVEEGAVAAAP